MKNLLILLFLCLFSISLAQRTASVLSLQQQINSANADSTRSRLFWKLGVYYEPINQDSCLHFLHQSLQAAQRSRQPYAIARAMHGLSHAYIYTEKNESKALEWANKSIAVAHKNNDYVHLAKSYQMLCTVSNHQNIGNSEEIAMQALRYAQKTNNWEVVTDSYGILANHYINEKNYRKAELFTAKALPLLEQHDLNHWFTYGINYAELLKRNGKSAQAEEMYRKLSSRKDKIPMIRGEWVYLNDVAKVEKGLKNYSEAERLLLKGLANERQRSKPDTLHLFFFYQNLTDLYTKQANYKKAYETGMLYTDMRQWLKEKRQTQDSKLQMTKWKAKLDLEKKEAEIALLARQKKDQQLLLIAALIIGLLLVCFVVILQYIRRRIERQKVELASLNATKDKLFAILSHDLRSPVWSLGSYLMLIDWGALSQREFVESVQDLNSQLLRVQDMLENVLNWSLSQLGGMRPKKESISIFPVLEEQLTLLQQSAKAKNILIELHVPPKAQLTVDKNHFAIIVRNLLHNAVKFTKLSGRVNIYYKEKRNSSYLEIKDTGVGISQENLKKLFVLNRETSRLGTAREGGTGLGLMLVKELMEANGGTIEVHSEVNLGTTFIMVFKREQDDIFTTASMESIPKAMEQLNLA